MRYALPTSEREFDFLEQKIQRIPRRIYNLSEATMIKSFLGITILLASISLVRAQAPDPALMAEIRKIRRH